MSEVQIAPLNADCLWLVDDPECAYCPSDAGEIFDSFTGPKQNDPIEVGLSRTVAKLWMVNVPTVFDDDGWAEEHEVRFYETQAEATDALAKAKP